jgi:hypothetical protein
MKIKIIGYWAHGLRLEASHIPDADPNVLDDISMVFADQGFTHLSVV